MSGGSDKKSQDLNSSSKSEADTKPEKEKAEKRLKDPVQAEKMASEASGDQGGEIPGSEGESDKVKSYKNQLLNNFLNTVVINENEDQQEEQKKLFIESLDDKKEEDTSSIESEECFDRPEKPKILLMGLQRSGKSSILKVVFQKMSPNETLFIESNISVKKKDIAHSSYIQFAIWDFPGQVYFINYFIDMGNIFKGCGAIVFVIDAQDDYLEALTQLNGIVHKAHSIDPNIRFEVFIHKVDGLSDDTKMDVQRDIHQRATDELAESSLEVHLTFYLTSIYDHSIFEAFSKVVQKLIPQLPTLENLLNIFISNSGIEKAFLFDVISKIYLATDSSPVDMQTYELCCDMIDVVIDVSCIYGVVDSNESTAFDHKSSSVIRLNNSTVLYLKEVNKALALVCVLREENFHKQSSIDYNFMILRRAIEDVFKVKSKILLDAENTDKSLISS